MHKADYFLPVQEIRNVKATTIVQIVSNFTTPLPQSSYMYTIQGLLKSPQCFAGLAVSGKVMKEIHSVGFI